MVSRNWILDEVPRKKTAHARRNARGPKLRIPRESDARKRETINIRGQRRASIFRIPALFLRSGVYVCVRACCYIHTYSPIYRGGNLEISRSPRVVSCAYRDAWCALFFSRPGLLGSPYSFFSPLFFYFCLRHRFRSRCATNFDYVRRKQPWSHAAIGRAQRKRDRRLARRREDDGRSWTEPSRAELSRYTRPG